MKKLVCLSIVLLTILASCTKKDTYKTLTETDANGYSYEYVTNDPYNLRVYSLKNGLKVYLSVNKDEPRIQTFIPVKAGSTYDPKDNTGLAHYLEHMMFKGTTKFGTVNWNAEKVLIDQISDLYEKHKATKDTLQKQKIYAQIDSISNIAAQYVAPNEYDRLISSIGGKYTNAYTSNERTVFMNNIPSNELEKWLQIESERFFNMVLRVFHTELETVYEEFNMGQDRDGSKVYKKLDELLFPTHPYGQQTTIGKAEHLKNPSMVNIREYWSKYYVPDNMAICLSGDLDPEETIQLIDKYFGKFKSKPVPEVHNPVENPMTKNVADTVYGPERESLNFAFRFNGVKSGDKDIVELIDYMLNNSTAGLIDLDLNQQQKVQRAGSYSSFLKDYGTHTFYGIPREGQSLTEVRDLILNEINKIKTGDFEDWLIEAVINNLKVDRIRNTENNWRAHNFAVDFTNNVSWEEDLNKFNRMSKITKEQIMQFVQQHYTNYAIVYKLKGEDKNVVKVKKPHITPVDLKRENESDFFTKLSQEKTKPISPVFVDYKKTIETKDFAPGVKYSYIHNAENNLFELNYIIDIGKNQSKELALAVKYLPYIGTDKYSAADLQKEFYRYGLNFGVRTHDKRSYVYVTGLEEYFPKAVELLEHLLANAKPDKEAYNNLIETIKKERSDKKLNKGAILYGGLLNYGMYGEHSEYRNNLSEDQLRVINPDSLTNLIKGITKKEHQLFYYGSGSNDEIFSLLKEKHVVPEKTESIPEPEKYTELDINKPIVYFVNYDMVQTQMLILSKDVKFDKDLIPNIRLFNQFYGDGLSSIVFQEIRESRGLAYSAYSYVSTPDLPEDSYYNYSFVATQPDKLKAACDKMKSLLTKIPAYGNQFELAKESITKNIATERITKSNIFWSYLNNKDLGIDYDNRKDVYDYMQNATIDDFKTFFNKHIDHNNYVYLVIGNKNQVDFNVLKKLGPVKELSVDEVFNF